MPISVISRFRVEFMMEELLLPQLNSDLLQILGIRRDMDVPRVVNNRGLFLYFFSFLEVPLINVFNRSRFIPILILTLEALINLHSLAHSPLPLI